MTSCPGGGGRWVVGAGAALGVGGASGEEVGADAAGIAATDGGRGIRHNNREVTGREIVAQEFDVLVAREPDLDPIGSMDARIAPVDRPEGLAGAARTAEPSLARASV